MLCGHLLKHWSLTQKAITLSSGEAELGGVVKGSAEGIGLQPLARDLGVELACSCSRTALPRSASVGPPASAECAT